jgi:hypothetical protein
VQHSGAQFGTVCIVDHERREQACAALKAPCPGSPPPFPDARFEPEVTQIHNPSDATLAAAFDAGGYVETTFAMDDSRAAEVVATMVAPVAAAVATDLYSPTVGEMQASLDSLEIRLYELREEHEEVVAGLQADINVKSQRIEYLEQHNAAKGRTMGQLVKSRKYLLNECDEATAKARKLTEKAELDAKYIAYLEKGKPPISEKPERLYFQFYNRDPPVAMAMGAYFDATSGSRDRNACRRGDTCAA